ncbi:MAG: histidine phosphatase family protein [Coriobacteriia bacterium]|nr:histidine phosphatase family protein [Coriobacteriia bacterium]MBS5478109.1 histidine phosphatase family protein [Coriobacteriia bacterium]
MAMLRMVLLRHSFSMGNARRQFSGMGDVELAPEGIQMVCDYREQGVYETYASTQRYYSSPLRRCRQTFELAFDGRKQLDGVVGSLHELDFGEAEGTSLEGDDMRAFFERWANGEPEPAAPHLESLRHLCDRGAIVARALALSCVRDGVESVTLVAHSAVSRALIVGLAGLPLQTFLEMQMLNALGYTLTLDVDDAAAAAFELPAGLATPPAQTPAYDPDAVRAADVALLANAPRPPYADVRLVRAVPYGPGSEGLRTITSEM